MTLWLGWVFLLFELVQEVLLWYINIHYKGDTERREVVDGSNESLYHADEEMHPLVRTFSPSQTIFQNLDVGKMQSMQHRHNFGEGNFQNSQQTD